MELDNLVRRIDQLLSIGHQVLNTRHMDEYGESEWIDAAKMIGFRSAGLSFIERVYGTKHPHYIEFNDSVNGHHPEFAETGIEILKIIRDEIAGGWLFSIKGLITAEIFADFLEMAEYLLSQGYKDPAAVMVGSVLEEHLKQLCNKNSIKVEAYVDGKPKAIKTDRLNSELAKNDIYNKLDQKAVTSWLDLRNRAAHGKYDEYTIDQVRNMLASVTEFLSRVAF
jgi:hypothetical protein